MLFYLNTSGISIVCETYVLCNPAKSINNLSCSGDFFYKFYASFTDDLIHISKNHIKHTCIAVNQLF